MIKRFLAMTVIVVLAMVMFIPASMASFDMWVYTANGKTLNAREYPSTDSPVLFNIPYGTKVTVDYHLGNGWTRLYAAGAYDWVFVQTRFLVNTPPGPKPTPEPDSGKSGSGTAVSQNELIAEFNAAKLVTPYEVVTRNSRATGTVNMRWAPSKSAPLIESYSNGTPLLVIAELKTWRQVEDPETGAVGFIRQDFLAKK